MSDVSDSQVNAKLGLNLTLYAGLFTNLLIQDENVARPRDFALSVVLVEAADAGVVWDAQEAHTVELEGNLVSGTEARRGRWRRKRTNLSLLRLSSSAR